MSLINADPVRAGSLGGSTRAAKHTPVELTHMAKRSHLKRKDYSKTISPERRKQLVQQAALMRERRAQKKDAHACPPSGIDRQYKRLLGALDRHAVGNTAPIPVAAMLEDGVWSVDVHVRIPRVTEYEVTGTGDTFEEALRNAADSLCRPGILYGRARREAEAFGLVEG